MRPRVGGVCIGTRFPARRGPTLQPGWQRVRAAAYRWLAIELAAGLAALCVTIPGVGMVISLLMTRDPAMLLPVLLGSVPPALWLAKESWPLVVEAWNGFPPLV